jgi:hypothetical protein
MKSWEKIINQDPDMKGIETFVLEGNGFFISYNPSCRKGDIIFFHGFDNKETALIKEDVYLILNGDHRKEYELLIDKGYEACKKYYESQNNQRSMWSSDNDMLSFDIDEIERKKNDK